MKVYDKDGNERDWQWAADRYGVELIEAEPPEGATVFRLSEIRQKVGPCGMTVQVEDEDGNRIPGVVVLQGWVDGPELPNEAAPRLAEDSWDQPMGKPNRGTGDFTNGDGVMGWGWGGGEQYDPTGGWGLEHVEGPHWYWIMPGDDQVYTDIILGLGWLLGTDHDTLTLTFQRAVGEDEPEEPEEPGNGDFAALLVELARITAALGQIVETWKTEGMPCRIRLGQD